MIVMLGAALVVTGLSGDAPAARASMTPVEHAVQDVHRIAFGAGSHRGHARGEFVLPFELEDGVEEHGRFRNDLAVYPGLSTAPSRRAQDRHARRHGVPALDRGGVGGAFGPAGGAVPPSRTDGSIPVSDEEALLLAQDDIAFDIPAAEAPPADAEVVAAGIVTKAAGGTKAAAALTSTRPLARDGADAVATPVPPSLLLFATGLAAFGVSRRKTA